MLTAEMPPPQQSKANSFGLFLLLGAGIIGLIAMGSAIWGIWNASAYFAGSPVSSYALPEYEPDKQVYCPNDTLTYTPTLVIEGAPRVIEFSMTVWKDQEPNELGERFIPPPPERVIFDVDGDYTRTLQVQLTGLEPGAYRLLRATQDVNSSMPALTAVRFNVAACERP